MTRATYISDENLVSFWDQGSVVYFDATALYLWASLMGYADEISEYSYMDGNSMAHDAEVVGTLSQEEYYDQAFEAWHVKEYQDTHQPIHNKI